jgi:Tfp pilus assembly protein PilX
MALSYGISLYVDLVVVVVVAVVVVAVVVCNPTRRIGGRR